MQLLDHIFACMLVAEARAIIQSSVLANKWGGDEGKPVDQKYRLPSNRKLLEEVFCWMTSFDLFYIGRLNAQRGNTSWAYFVQLFWK